MMAERIQRPAINIFTGMFPALPRLAHWFGVCRNHHPDNPGVVSLRIRCFDKSVSIKLSAASTKNHAKCGRTHPWVNVIKLAGSHLLIASDQLAYSASCAATCMACKPCGSRGGAVPCAAGMSVLAELARPCGRRQ